MWSCYDVFWSIFYWAQLVAMGVAVIVFYAMQDVPLKLAAFAIAMSVWTLFNTLLSRMQLHLDGNHPKVLFLTAATWLIGVQLVCSITYIFAWPLAIPCGVALLIVHYLCAIMVREVFLSNYGLFREAWMQAQVLLLVGTGVAYVVRKNLTDVAVGLAMYTVAARVSESSTLGLSVRAVKHRWLHGAACAVGMSISMVLMLFAYKETWADYCSIAASCAVGNALYTVHQGAQGTGSRPKPVPTASATALVLNNNVPEQHSHELGLDSLLPAEDRST